ncbi:hypothetical protein AYO45_05320 [Gammaproteobacteria bacterium SCGC AG-212-F23]|nr:hypothetical protein AYO45_05320 [Gammaproteobacteria bacterium SCGC AG-212-F23]
MTSHLFTKPERMSIFTRQLLARMQGQLCGIDNEIGFMLRSSQDPKVIVTGAELTGVHHLLKVPHPGKGAYHLGGCGIKLNEAVIRTLGETVERYSQLLSEIAGISEYQFASYAEMRERREHVINLDKISYFKKNQYDKKAFPFDPITPDKLLTWVKLSSLLHKKYLWVPAQLVLVGYKIKRLQGEPWIASAVTTGTAAHTDKNQALINAIMELIQIDSAMGHWYSLQIAPKIIFDERTKSIESLLNKYNPEKQHQFSFHWLKNADMPGFSIACFYRGAENTIPRVTIGLGASIELNDAMYKAYLEAIGIIGLSRMLILDKKLSNENISHATTENFFDLDSNVAYYAAGNGYDFIENKFPETTEIIASQLPPDLHSEGEETLKILVRAFRDTNKELYFYDLTGVEAEDLNFVVPRVWSPDLLSLCFPSTPFMNHSRFTNYQGIQHDHPHPYP